MSPRKGLSRRRFLQGTAGLGVTGVSLEVLGDVAHAAESVVRNENLRTGTPRSQWWPGRDRSIVGYPTEISVAPGDTVAFKIATDATEYMVSIYRMGWYGGDGARLVHQQQVSWGQAQRQPAPLTDPATLLVDCSNWSTSATWTVPDDAVSGVYLTNFRRLDTGGAHHTWFVVRRRGPSDLLVQTSDMTWQAYNRFGGASLYWSVGGGFADRVSYQRPLEVDGIDNEFLTAEYPLIRWLERNGFDVAYGTNLDTHRDPSLLTGRKVFISSGHDEYWSGPMRAHVEAARDAGVHLIFLSGNEVFWRVRLEPSIGPGAQADQTITCYKETTDNAKTDPSPQWTGTWRDPRFTPPGVGGANPENRLTGQLFRCIYPMGVLDPALEVPARFAPLRFWRFTAVASLQPGETLTLGTSTLGFEWDVDVDDDHRPPGLIQLSETTVNVPEILQDFGSTYAPGTETHHLTLYRAPSGALVFGAGTVQWSFGLDEVHQSDQVPADRTMQQATMNLLADMGVQPATPQAGLVTSGPSTDDQPPVSQITSPSPGVTSPVGSTLVISGTAYDLGGGVVAGVEVSTDDGRTWRRAVGTTSWSFVTSLTSPLGPRVLRCRATDDSGNLERTWPAVQIEVVARELPATLFPDGYRPAIPTSTDTSPVEVGLRLRSSVDGWVTALRCFRGPSDTSPLVGSLWTAGGVRLATATFPTPDVEGWQEVPISAVAMSAGIDHVVSVWRPEGRYGADVGLLDGRSFDVWPLSAPASGDSTAGAPSGNGLFRYGSSTFPTSTYAGSAYGVDLRFDSDASPGGDITVIDTRPDHELELVSLGEVLNAVLSRPIDPSSVSVTVTIDGDTTSNPAVGITSWDQERRTVRFEPAAPWAPATTYRVRLVVTRGSEGEPLDLEHQWSFTTTGPAGTLPTGLVDTSTTPLTIVTDDRSAVELGLKIRSQLDGDIRAVRAYIAPGSPGPIVGHVWRADGTLAGTAVISTQGATADRGFGWRQAPLEPAVPVAAGELVTVSYHAPGGIYAASTAALAASPLTRGPLSAPLSSVVDGNGVYRYGPPAMPTNNYLDTWYLSDVVFDRAGTGASELTLTDRSPRPGLVAVDPATVVTMTWSSPIDIASTSVTVSIAATEVAGDLQLDPDRRTLRWQPRSALPPGVDVTVTARTRSVDGGDVISTSPWSFRTDGGEGSSPATLWSTASIPTVVEADDDQPVELGVVWRSDVDGRVTALRFYKAPGNIGPHIGRLWSEDGGLLATVVFDNMSTSGWQQAAVEPPVPITAGTAYVASYHAPRGRYSITLETFSTQARRRAPLVAPVSTSTSGNGRFVYGRGGFPTGSYLGSDYGVDVVVEFDAGLAVVQRVPIPGSLQVATDTPVEIRFDRDVDPSSVTVRIRDDADRLLDVSLTVLDARTLQWTPIEPWTSANTITVGLVAAVGLDGSRLEAPLTWTFRVVGDNEATIWSLFDPSERPPVASADDASRVEVGVRVRCDVAAEVLGLRHFVGPNNSGPHVMRLWTDDGQLLAEATAPTGSGWVETRFDAPVPIDANSLVVASYIAPSGGYAFDPGRLGSAVVSGPLTAPADGTLGPNGCFRYGGGFPNQSYLGASYGVDVIVAVRA